MKATKMRRLRQKAASSAATALPHSWRIADWPAAVAPGSAAAGRYLVRANKDSLLLAGALSRVGRTLIVHGSRFERWLEQQAANVPDFESSANRGES